MGSEKVWEGGVALTSTLHWFETELLAREENLTSLAILNRELLALGEGVGSSQPVVLDMDSSESPVYGEQEQSAYNGYFESVCYHSLFLFDRQGDCLGGKVVKHTRYYWLLLAEAQLTRQRFGSMVRKIERCRCRTGSEPGKTAIREPRSHPVRTSASSEAGWRRKAHQTSHRERLKRPAMPSQEALRFKPGTRGQLACRFA